MYFPALQKLSFVKQLRGCKYPGLILIKYMYLALAEISAHEDTDRSSCVH